MVGAGKNVNTRKISMDKKDISIATIAWARDDEEERLLISSLQQLAKLNIPVFITDGGSRKSFLDFLKSIPNFTLLQHDEHGLWHQARISLNAAAKFGTKFIFYTEPDKKDFFENHLEKMLDDIEVNELSGITLASRSKKAFETFPAFQQMTETTINNCCKEVTDKELDFTYGPFLLNSKLVAQMQELPANIGWGWRPYAFCISSIQGYNIDHFLGDFFCPADQQTDDAQGRIYRMKQLAQNIEGITLSATFKK